MSDVKGQDRNVKIGLSGGGQGAGAKKGGESNTVRQSFSHGRSKAVAVEVVKRRRIAAAAPAPAPAGAAPARGAAAPAPNAPPAANAPRQAPAGGRSSGGGGQRRQMVLKPLTDDEKRNRLKVLSEARKAEDEARKRAEENARRANEEASRRRAEEEAALKRKAEEDSRRRTEGEARRKAEEQAARLLAEEEAKRNADEAARTKRAAAAPSATPADAEAEARRAEAPKRGAKTAVRASEKDEEEEKRIKGGRVKSGGGKPTVAKRPGRGATLTLDEEGEGGRQRSLASMRRQRERERQRQAEASEAQVREVVLPETISVQDLAARMAVRSGEVVKALMRNGVMATINQLVDADTAEVVVGEFGHTVKRVSESDVEEGLEGTVDRPEDLRPRAPVVTVMGHVDHGKTSLLDALRKTDVAAGEAGGITQHIGAYQVDIGHGTPVTFIDTPGHAAFTQMRARGASITDIVVLVVAADDGVMPQTIEAISHAKAAKVPIVVAINKIDRPEADPSRVKQELLSHDVVAEDFGGDVQAIEVSAVKRTNLDKLIEALQLQAELLELKGNPAREAIGTVVEARLDRGRGAVATVLVENGTLHMGDIVVAGAQWGRTRAMTDDRGQPIKAAGPATPVEILGLDGVPEAGDRVVTVEGEKRAREITDYRERKRREQSTVAGGPPKASLEDMFTQLKAGQLQTLPVVVKSDVHGSLEAIGQGLEKLSTDEVSVRVLHGGVGPITESDVTLAGASNAVIIGFNVRANAQAREMAKRDGIEIRYYAIIYELLDEVKGLLSGMLAPEAREEILGHAQVRQVFGVPKLGKVAGCMVVDGVIRRGAKCRLLRDDVVIYEGRLGSLRRYKDDVREVREGFDCGMSIEGYQDVQEGDLIEAFEVKEVARSL